MALVCGREVGVPMDDAPGPADATQDVGDAESHVDDVAAVDADVSALEADGVGEVAAVADHFVSRDESAVGESARHPVEGAGHRGEATLDRSPGAEQRDVAIIGPQRRGGTRVTCP